MTREILRRVFARAGAAMATVVLCAGCMADPMPSPGLSALDTSRVLVSAAADGDGGPLRLVGVIGLQGAAPGRGLLELLHPRSDTLLIKPVSEVGSFAAVVTASPGDRLVLTFRDPDGVAGSPVELVVAPYDFLDAPATPENVSRDDSTPSVSISPPDDAGRVTVSGEFFAEGDVAVLGNSTTGAVAETTIEQSAFSVQLSASSGDTIVVIVRNPLTELASEVASLTVPPR